MSAFKKSEVSKFDEREPSLTVIFDTIHHFQRVRISDGPMRKNLIYVIT